MRPWEAALQAKGPLQTLRRATAIGRRYGATPARMDAALERFAVALEQYSCGATFPVTTTALARSSGVMEKYLSRNIELAVHGLQHVDHTHLTPEELATQLSRAREAFEARGLPARGFRSPYLRWSPETLSAVRACGYLYDSSHALDWGSTLEHESVPYRRALAFYGATSAQDVPSLPTLDGGLVRIPYCLPDDEALIDRLGLEGTSGPRANPWLSILIETYLRGELFTLGLHPERIDACEPLLLEVLDRARAATPRIWIARLDEIAAWWKERSEATVRVTREGRALRVRAIGPIGVVFFLRGIPPPAGAIPWADGEYLLDADELRVECDARPFVGVTPAAPFALVSFLREQGFIVELSARRDDYALYLDRVRFRSDEQRPLLDQIERGDFPLIRLGRWPGGARSALAVSGDVDALTLWDYGARLLKR